MEGFKELMARGQPEGFRAEGAVPRELLKNAKRAGQVESSR